MWKITQIGKIPKLNNPILLEGLPGIGNVGKIAIDFILDELKAKPFYDLFSYTFPHSVFVNERNLVELPKIELYYKKYKDPKKNDLIFLVGDVQPVDEESSYEFVVSLLDLLTTLGIKEIITTGGIGMQTMQKKPKVYCTANNIEIVKKFKKSSKDLNSDLYGVVGPIVGVSGLLLGMGEKYNIPGIALLAETFGHPMYLGIKGAKEIVNVLNKQLKLNIKPAKLEKDIKEMDALKKTDELQKVSKSTAMDKVSRLKDTIYIG